MDQNATGTLTPVRSMPLPVPGDQRRAEDEQEQREGGQERGLCDAGDA